MRKILCGVLILLICLTTTLVYAVENTVENIAENENTENNTTNILTATDLQSQRELLQKQLDEAKTDRKSVG